MFQVDILGERERERENKKEKGRLQFGWLFWAAGGLKKGVIKLNKIMYFLFPSSF